MNQRRTSVLPYCLLSAALSLAVAPTVHAQPLPSQPTAADKETARSLVDQGDKLFAAFDYAGALKLYKAAHTTMGVPTTGLRLARAQVALGQLVEARDTFLSVARYPERAGEPSAFTNARAEATQEAGALAARIPSVEVTVQGPTAGTAITVKVDDDVMPPEAATLPHKVNPGTHHVIVSAPGFRDGFADVVVKEAQTGRVSVALAAAAPGSPPGRASQGTPAASAREGDGSAERTAGFIVGGVGIVGLGLGTVFGIDALSKKSDRNPNCNAAVTVCNQTGIDDDSSGRTAATISTIAFAAGVVGVGVGAVLLLTSHSGTSSQSGAVATGASVALAPSVTPSGGGLLLRGAW